MQKMTTATITQDTISIPKTLFTDFLVEFDKMKILYEKIDHIVATKELEKGETKSFTDVNELFDDLDN